MILTHSLSVRVKCSDELVEHGVRIFIVLVMYNWIVLSIQIGMSRIIDLLYLQASQ